MKDTRLAAEGMGKVDPPRTKEDDARLSETKEESEVGENSKKGVDKTTSVKDTRLAVEGMERVDPKTKKASYDTKVDDDANLAAGDKKNLQSNIAKLKT